jgi:hypothetical protein
MGHLQSLANVSLQVVRFCTFRADENNCHRPLEAHGSISRNQSSCIKPGIRRNQRLFQHHDATLRLVEPIE